MNEWINEYDNEKENWRILTNKDIHAIVKEPNITETKRLNILCWFGHVQRMEENRIPKKVLYRFIRNDCRGDQMLLAWPPLSPDATPCDFFLWGYVKDQVYVPPLPASIPELKVRIRTATETINSNMVQTVWNELDYRVDVCRITKGAHIEHL